MTATLVAALKALPQVRVGRVVCGADGAPVIEGILKHGIYRVCQRAGLRLKGWHVLRHTFATHAAHFGVNPWRLQAWLGHSSINMTMRYVHHVQEHARPIPEDVLAAGQGVVDPDERVIRMLGARSSIVRGNGVATDHLSENQT
jgi:integrase